MRVSAGLKGFSGKIMRNAREETYFSPFRAAANFRASERRAEFIRAMPSAAENLKANFRASERRAERLR